ncbi:MAG: tRNA-dihydrouridine synthase family protein [Desulfomonilia bacterium]|nr:tRNA-dihydrouridine synthase family protein [Desulfomonilia bacterium]
MQLLPDHALLMAPMVDLSHGAYRNLVRSFSGCDLFYSEMLNARIVPTEKPQTSLYLRWKRTDDLIFQLLGNDPERMHLSALKLDGYAPFGIDINMGCWLKKVTTHGWGVKLMEDLNLASRVVTSVRRATQRPLSVKMRIGYSLDREVLLDFASMLEDVGVDFIVLHARTAQDGLSRRARWEYITFLKERLRIPVIGNGDIRSADDACRMFRITGCDGVMVGRQALIQPWIFRDIRLKLSGLDTGRSPALDAVILSLLGNLEERFPEDVACKRFKTALFWLAQNHQFGHHLTKLAGTCHTVEGLKRCIVDFFAVSQS